MDIDQNDPSDCTLNEKMHMASVVANDTMAALIANVVPGKKVIDLCLMGDNLIVQGVESMASKIRPKVEHKGVCFPTCISTNNIVGHFSPNKGDTTEIKEGDVVKIDLGVHIDGYISQCAHTVIASNSYADPVEGRRADVICAAYFAAECVQRLIRPGATNVEVTNAIDLVAKAFHCSPVEAVLSHQIKRYVIDGNKVIMNRSERNQQAHDITFEADEAYVVDIVMSTAEGKPRESPIRTTVFKQAVDHSYNLKMASSRAVASEIKKRFKTFPFSVRSLNDPKAKLGIVELVKHDLVQAFPVLEEKEGEFVAQIKFTFCLGSDEQKRMNAFDAPFVSSKYSIDECPELVNILAAEGTTQEESEMASSGIDINQEQDENN